MEFLKPELIFVVLLLVVPGLLSQTVFTSMVSRGKIENHQWSLYQSLLHSVAIYLILYPLAILFFGVDNINIQAISNLIKAHSWAPIAAVVVIILVSIAWGIIYSKFYLIVLLGFLDRFAVPIDPSNVFSRLFEKSKEGFRFWLTVKDGDVYIVGSVELDSTDRTPREVFLKDISFLDSNRKQISTLPENYGIVINLDKYSIVEIKEVEVVEAEDQV